MKILVADDNLFYSRMLSATLEEWDYQVLTANCGEQAWQILHKKDGPRLAILDWVMPDLDGLELCRRIRSHPLVSPTYVILLTAKGGKDNIITGLESGADDFISKPFDREELHARLRVGLRVLGLQEKLAAKVDELEIALSGAQKMEAVGRLAGGVAHDFNNLLTVINGCTSVLESMAPADSRRAEFLHMIQGAGERGASLTRQLLAFSRRQILQPANIHLNDLVTNTEKMLRRLIGEDIDLKTALDPFLGCIRADSGQIEQVIMNLVVNSRDAMPAGGKITLETKNIFLEGTALVAAGYYVLLAVSDTGCGMDDQTRAHIFEPFFTTKEAGKGTGLGLATVYGIVKQSGGHIQVDTAPGRGTTFKLFFPRLEEGLPAPASLNNKLAHEEGKGETILLVEDEDPVRLTIRHILESFHYRVLEAHDGQQALQISEEWTKPIHLLLTDIVMPKFSGNQLADRLAAMRPDLKVLFMSGYTNDIALLNTVVDSGRPLLQKPFTSAFLRGKIREILDK